MSSKKTVIDENYFRVVREQLRYWPYAVHQIDDTLDISLIEGRGRQLLFQAINAKNLTAFAGSGLSAAYGRLSWRDWETEQFSVVEVGSKAFQAIHKASFDLSEELEKLVSERNTSHDSYTLQQRKFRDALRDKNLLDHSDRDSIYRWLASRKRRLDTAWRQIDRLYQTFLRSRSDDSGFPGGEALPIKFQIAQQLHEELRKNIELFMPLEENVGSYQDTFARCWPGTRIDRESAPPIRALDKFKDILESHPVRNVVEATEKFDIAMKYYFDAYSRKQARVSAQDLAKMLLIDERAHAMITLRSGLLPGKKPSEYTNEEMVKISNIETSLGIYDSEALKRNIDGIRENPELFRVLSAFSFDSVTRILEDLKERKSVDLQRWGGFLDYTKKRFEEYQNEVKRSGDERRYLSPSSRYLMATYLCLHNNAWSLLGELGSGTVKNDNVNLLRPVDSNSFTSRRSIIANRFDPLSKISRQLGVSKYITTNYDLEIERYFQDQGYRKFNSLANLSSQSTIRNPSDNEFRSDSIGGVLIDQGFERTQAAQLVSFALGSNSKDAAIYHLHGCAVQNSNLVITERDYMNLYLLADMHRDTVNEGIYMAFSSSPLIFLGLGMNEADLLRPLRQFMSNRDRTVGYHAVALLPAEKPIEERTKFAVTCYLRYGVHAIFYGSGQIEFPEAKGQEAKTLGIDWLCRIMLLVRALHSELDGLSSQLRTDPKPTDNRTVLGRLAQAVSTVSEDIGGYPPQTVALMTLFGRVVQLNSSDPSDEDWCECIGPYVDEICNKAISLVDCEFTPIRPSSEIENIRHYENGESVNVQSKPYVGFAKDILGILLLVVLDMHRRPGNTPSMEREIEAARVTLNGLAGAFFTGCLNAQLTGIEKEWRSWWKNWQQSPPHRLPRFQKLPVFELSPGHFVCRYVRHRVDSIITNVAHLDTFSCRQYPFQKNSKNGTEIRDSYKTRIRSFDSFVIALSDSLPHSTIKSTERLLVTVAAHRGLGKGTFLSAMSTRLGMYLYSNATWNNIGRDIEGGSQPFIFSAAFVNLSFSTEVASTYDMLLQSLLESCSIAEAACEDMLESKKTCSEVKLAIRDSLDSSLLNSRRIYYYKNVGSSAAEAYKRLESRLSGVSRQRSIEILLSSFKDVSNRCAKNQDFGRPRFLLYLGGVELFFDSEGNPKNGEIKNILDYLTGRDTQEYPLDVIIVGSEAGLGCPFNLSEKKRDFQQHRLDKNSINDRAEEQIHQRILDGKLIIDKVVKVNRNSDKKHSDKPINYVHFARPFSPVSVLVDNFPVLSTALYINNIISRIDDPQTFVVSKQVKNIGEEFNKNVRDGRDVSDMEMGRLWADADVPDSMMLDGARKRIWTSVEAGAGSLIVDCASGEISATIHADAVRNVLREWFRNTGNSYREEWRSVRRYLGNNRFSTTILLAAAEHIVVHSAKAVKGGVDAGRFIWYTIDQVRNVGYEKREQLVLQIVIDLYRRYTVIGDPDLDSQFHQLLMRHLGVIGAPISAGVLVRLPEIRDYFTSLGDELITTRRRYLARALTVLAYRGLVFRLDPHPRLTTLAKTTNHEADTLWPAKLEFRYALHRSVQRYAISKLGVGNSDPIELNSFAPRLYASMPSVGNGLTQESYNFLRSLLVGLSQYPDVPQDDPSLRSWLFASSVTNVRVQALRAALSLARSTLSVATLSRFVDIQVVATSAQKLGLLEAYKIRLRWIIRMAWEVVEPDQVMKADNNVKAELSHINALYRDEIVWLYNELGVIGISQGKFVEALGFLRQAAELNEDIEGRSRFGPIFDYIDLNHAVVQLERGRLRSATRRLKRIRKKSNGAPELLRTIAKGYLCVIRHITGKNEGLPKNFEQVIVKLQDLNDTRASAIFLSHWAKSMSDADCLAAIEQLQRAKALAETGGHEDIRHSIEISRITTQFRFSKDTGKYTENTASPLRQLSDIEMYGKRMGVWSLQVDSLKLRAELLLNQGETSTAGSLIIRAMSIAKRNSMNLRLNSAITVYAKILHQRGDLEGAEVHALKSLEMAKSMRYSLETSRAQVVLSEINPTMY